MMQLPPARDRNELVWRSGRITDLWLDWFLILRRNLNDLSTSAVMDHLRDVTQVEVVNATVGTIFSDTVVGGVLSTNKKLRLLAIGDVLNNTGGNQTVRLSATYGGTLIFDTGAVSIAASASRRPVQIDCELAAANSVSAQVVWARVVIGAAGDVGGTSMSAPAVDVVGIHNALGINSALDQTLLAAVTLGIASGNLSFRCHTVHVELVN